MTTIQAIKFSHYLYFLVNIVCIMYNNISMRSVWTILELGRTILTLSKTPKPGKTRAIYNLSNILFFFFFILHNVIHKTSWSNKNFSTRYSAPHLFRQYILIFIFTSLFRLAYAYYILYFFFPQHYYIYFKISIYYSHNILYSFSYFMITFRSLDFSQPPIIHT